MHEHLSVCLCLSVCSGLIYCFLSAYNIKHHKQTSLAVKNKVQRNMIKDFRSFSFLPPLKNEAPWILLNVKNYLDNGLNNRTNVLCPR